MDCFHDFCLACDKESNGPYCSQACRMADLERASPPALPSSPTQAAPSRLSWSSLSPAPSSVYVLQPAYNFTDKTTSQSVGLDHRPQTSYFMRYPTEQASDEASLQRSLTPSTSRSSLSSTASNGTATSAGGISQQSRLELHDYFSSFVKPKTPNRRSTMK
ncbi:hypothetical protein LTR02_005181 [Friedmanniomyces endolithicus]|nr:hypothetical protein LTR38_004823 [Friedmanniomyces endolithicus]KAK0863922.1 hypothetical protein LTS02_006313 [Friedmanniomyces endolithicus]KAK0885900.1 hypothetical protein LTR87_000604 [Friedmanniomyces endolithicus]KAK0907991.1 hypothetical protein LTR02_005181 [Friedmanniomyces endolithicus]KAK1044622.1 hypothetical protein LTS16_007191 [Friedmanniomyces endolithicus]